MDQNLLPPLPSVEDLFAPSTSQSSSLSVLKNVRHFIPVPTLPQSPSTTSVPPVHTGPCSPVPPQPTSPLVDRFDFQVEGSKTSDSVLQLEKSTHRISSSQELLQESPPAKKVRFSETAEVVPLLQDDGREEGEISDDTDDDVQVVSSSKNTASSQKPSSLSHTVHRNERTRQSVSHRRVPTDSSENTTKTLHSSSHRRHQSHTSDVTEKSSHHRSHRHDRSHSISKDASKSSHHHQHRVDGARASKTERSSVSQKTPASYSDGQKQPDYNKHSSKSSSHQPLSNDRVAGRESAKCESKSLNSSNRLEASHSAADTRKSSVDVGAKRSCSTVDKASHSAADSHKSSVDVGAKGSCSTVDKASHSAVDTHKSSVDVGAKVSCSTADKTSYSAVDTRKPSVDFDAEGSCSTVGVCKSSVDMDAPYSPGSLDLDYLFDSDFASELQQAISHGDRTSNKIGSGTASVPYSSLASNTVQHREILNMNAGDSATASVLTAMNTKKRHFDSDLASGLQKAVSHGDETSHKIGTVNTSFPCLDLVSNAAQNRDIANVDVRDSTTTSVVTAMNVEDRQFDFQQAISCGDKASHKIDAMRASVPCSGVASNATRHREILNMNAGDSSTVSALTVMNTENRHFDPDLASDLQKAAARGDKTRHKIGTNLPCFDLASSTAQNREIGNRNVRDSTTSILTAMNVEQRHLHVQQAVSHYEKTSRKVDTVIENMQCLVRASNTTQNGETTSVNIGSFSTTSDLTAVNVEDLDIEIDTHEPVDKLPTAEEVEMTAESAAVDGVSQEYEIIDDLESNADEMDVNAGASTDNSDMELDSAEEETLPDKHIKPQHSRHLREAAFEQTRNNLKPFVENGDDAFQAPVVNNKLILLGESENVSLIGLIGH